MYSFLTVSICLLIVQRISRQQVRQTPTRSSQAPQPGATSFKRIEKWPTF